MCIENKHNYSKPKTVHQRKNKKAEKHTNFYTRSSMILNVATFPVVVQFILLKKKWKIKVITIRQ
jgi:hypothetical protein